MGSGWIAVLRLFRDIGWDKLGASRGVKLLETDVFKGYMEERHNQGVWPKVVHIIDEMRLTPVGKILSRP